MKKPGIYNADSLAKKAGVSRRTIHYYLQRGLLMPPEGEGRGSYYTDAHLQRLKQLQQLSAQGVPLAKIKEHFENGAAVSEVQLPYGDEMAPPAERWERVVLADGVELHLKQGMFKDDLRRELLKRVGEAVEKLLES